MFWGRIFSLLFFYLSHSIQILFLLFFSLPLFFSFSLSLMFSTCSYLLRFSLFSFLVYFNLLQTTSLNVLTFSYPPIWFFISLRTHVQLLPVQYHELYISCITLFHFPIPFILNVFYNFFSTSHMFHRSQRLRISGAIEPDRVTFKR